MSEVAAAERQPVGEQTARSGAQSIERAFEVLRIVASNNASGMRLRDVVDATGLAMPTAHRILKRLEKEGAIERLREGKRYVIGSEMTLLGLSTPLRSFRAIASPALRSLCEQIGDAVFLSVPSRLDTVCADRKIGSYPIQVLSIETGSRRPLGISANGVALMSRMREDCVEDILEQNAERLSAYETPLDTMRRRIATAREKGYVFIEAAIVKNTRALAYPICDPAGRPIAAVSTITVSWRLPKKRVPSLLQLLKQAAREISDQLVQQRAHSRL